MDRQKQLELINEFIKNRGVTHCAPDTRGKDWISHEFELKRKAYKAQMILQKKKKKDVLGL
tara:strand:- start:1324 stop:1506 length:183 start_codon:yes stop_codon:yes gene_type:complete